MNTVLWQSADRRTTRLYALELCDPPQADKFGYAINGVTVSNFVHPAWFGAPKPIGGKYDQMNKITAPFQLLSGDYISYLSITPSASGWKQITAETAGIHPHREAITEGSRRIRRLNSYIDSK